MKISLIRAAILGAAAILLSACSMFQGGDESNAGADVSKSNFEQSYQEAEVAYNRAKESNNIWVNTEEHMAKAKEAAAKGDYQTAIQLAKNAKEESDMAYSQYEAEKDIKPWL